MAKIVVSLEIGVSIGRAELYQKTFQEKQSQLQYIPLEPWKIHIIGHVLSHQTLGDLAKIHGPI